MLHRDDAAVAPALGPEEIEQQITFPIEQVISGLPGLELVRSISKFGLSQVVATFEDGTDIYFARQLVHERLGTVELPAGIERPRLGPVATGLGEVFHYIVTSDGKTISGRRLNEDTYTIQMVDDQGRLVSLEKSNVKELKIQTEASMPSFKDKLT